MEEVQDDCSSSSSGSVVYIFRSPELALFLGQIFPSTQQTRNESHPAGRVLSESPKLKSVSETKPLLVYQLSDPLEAFTDPCPRTCASHVVRGFSSPKRLEPSSSELQPPTSEGCSFSFGCIFVAPLRVKVLALLRSAYN